MGGGATLMYLTINTKDTTHLSETTKPSSPLQTSNSQAQSNKTDSFDNLKDVSHTRSNSSTDSAKLYSLGAQVVQANKFDQNIREVDGSIAVASGKDLQNLQIQGTQDLSKIFPGFVLKTPMGSAFSFASIRGLSSDFYNPSLVVYVDEIPQDPAFLAQELLDVKQVELLRGPQGTIWGQNAQSGVLNIITNTINSNTPRLNASTQIGSLTQNAMFSLSTPLIKDWIYIGGNFAYKHYAGMINQKNTQTKLDVSDEYLGNISIELAPRNSHFSALFKYSKDKLNDHHSGFTLTHEQYQDLEVDIDDPDLGYFIPSTYRDIDTYALKLGYDFGHSKLINVVSYQSRNYDQDFQLEKLKENRKTTTEELRLSTQYGNGAYSIFGLYYQNLNTEVYTNKIDKNTFAVYGDGKIPLWYGFDFSLGARYSCDSSELRNMINDTYSKGTFTPKVALGYNLGEYTRFYVLYQIGYKPGGFDYATGNKINPENTQNFELGLHSNFLENKIALDVAAYYIYIADKQTYVGSLGEAILKNVGKVDSKGLEASLALYLIEPLKISLGTTIGQSKYIQYTDRMNQSLKGNTLPYAPDITTNANIDWKILGFNWASFFLNLNANFYSKTYFDGANLLSQNPYILLDASVRMEAKNGLALNFFIQNATNQKYKNYTIDYTAFGLNKYHVVGDSVNFGINASYRF